MKTIILSSLLFVNTAYAVGINPTPSQTIHAHPIDQYGNWNGVEDKSEFSVGEVIEFVNPYKIPLWQQDGWRVKDLQTNKFLGCVPLFSSSGAQACKMIFWDVANNKPAPNNCDDANEKRSFNKPGNYQIMVMSTGPGYCGAPVTYKTITIIENPTTDNLAWLVPVISLMLN